MLKYLTNYDLNSLCLYAFILIVYEGAFPHSNKMLICLFFIILAVFIYLSCSFYCASGTFLRVYDEHFSGVYVKRVCF